MAHQKIIEAYKKEGVPWEYFEKGHEVTVRQKKELLKGDRNATTTVLSVYRKRIDSSSDTTIEPGQEPQVIVWHQETVGKSTIGNRMSYHENPEDICIWFEPITKRKIQWNSEKEESFV